MKESRRYLDESANGVLLELFPFVQPKIEETRIRIPARTYLETVLEKEPKHVRENLVRAAFAKIESASIKELLLSKQPDNGNRTGTGLRSEAEDAISNGEHELGWDEPSLNA